MHANPTLGVPVHQGYFFMKMLIFSRIFILQQIGREIFHFLVKMNYDNFLNHRQRKREEKP
jgi:hypothetical protein